MPDWSNVPAAIRCSTPYPDSSTVRGGQLFVCLLAPLKYVEFDKSKRDQLQERVPEAHEVSFHTPVDGGIEQCRVQEHFHDTANE